MNILDHFKTVEEFVPETVDEYIILQIARRLNDMRNLNWHLRIMRKHPIDEIVGAFQSARKGSSDPIALIEEFHSHYDT